MLESKAAILFRHWLKANPQYSCAYEIKSAVGDSLPFSALEEHQQAYLEAIGGDKGVLVRVRGVSGEPDYVYLRNFPANVVVKYPRSFEIISIGTWVLEKSRSKRKSLLSSRAKEISTISVRLS